MARRCSPVRSLSIRPVSPVYRTGQRRHEMQYITLLDLQVKCSLMVMLCHGPAMMVVADTWAHVQHLGAPQGYVPAGDPD